MERTSQTARTWMHRIRSEVLVLLLLVFFLVTLLHAYNYLEYTPRPEASVSFTFYQSNVSAPTIGDLSVIRNKLPSNQMSAEDDMDKMMMHKNAKAPKSTGVKDGPVGRPKVALMFLTRGKLHNEPTWRAFFEAAGRLTLRSHTVTHQDASYVEGVGKEFFKRVNRNETRRLKELETSGRPERCGGRQELKLIIAELNRIRLDRHAASQAIANQDLFSVYTHPSAGFKFPKNSMFRGTEVHARINTFEAWGKFGLMAAETQLMRAALVDKRNQKFVMLSESCVPLHRPEVIYLQLMSETKSRVNACGAFQERNKLWRWNDEMLSGYLSPVNWRFSSQWVALKRSHVEIIVKDKHVRRRFKQHCSMQAVIRCVPDEHYIPTALSVYGVTQETDCVGQLTALRRLEERRAHAISFARWNINATLFNRLKRVDVCKTGAAQVSTRHVFDDGHRGERCLKFNATEIGVIDSEADDWVRHSGYIPLPYECSLFARKFSIRAIWTTARTALSCAGGGLGYWC